MPIYTAGSGDAYTYSRLRTPKEALSASRMLSVLHLVSALELDLASPVDARPVVQRIHLSARKGRQHNALAIVRALACQEGLPHPHDVTVVLRFREFVQCLKHCTSRPRSAKNIAVAHVECLGR